MNPEFSRTIRADQISSRGVDMALEAQAAERQALAARFDLKALHSLTATVRLKALAGGKQYRVDANFVAEVTQTCVVSLEPMDALVEDQFCLIYAPVEDQGECGELDVHFDEDDPPEPLMDGVIDVGEAVAEHLALALDPFPRRSGVECPDPVEPENQAENRQNPFAALAGMIKKEG